MKRNERIISLLLTATLMVSLSSCGKEETTETTAPIPETTVMITEETTVATEPTEAVAETVAEETTAPTEETTASAEKVTEAPVRAASEEVTETPTEEVTEAPTEEVTEAPTEEVTEAPTEEVTEAPTEEVTEAPTEEVTEAPTEEPTEETVPVVETVSAEIDAETGLVQDTDENVNFYAQAGAVLRRMVDKANMILLDQGSVLCDVAAEEPQEVHTNSCIVSASEGLFYVDVTTEDGVEYAETDVFSGEVTITIPETGESLTLKAGESAMTAKQGEEPAAFVKNGEEGTIDYQALPKTLLEKLIGFANQDRALSITAGQLTCLVEGTHEDRMAVMKHATCTEDGIRRLTCARCGDVREEAIPALGHTEKKLPRVEPDCTHTGLTAGVHCSYCGATVVAQETIPALGHKEEEIPAVEPDCIHHGLTAGTRCTVCGDIVTQQKDIPALGHTEKEIPAVAPDCENTGLTAGAECAVCGAVLKQQFSIDALGHKPVMVAGHEPTCVETGLTDGTRCTVCGKWIQEQIVIPVHEPKIHVTPGLAPTCEEAGYSETETCTICGHVVKESQVIPAAGHTPYTIPGRETTCTRYGLTDGQRCSVCDKWLVRREIIPMKAHTPKYAPTVEPTCTAEGSTEGMVCADCGKVLEGVEPIPMKPHRHGSYSDILPTCTEVGWTMKVVCLDCDAILLDRYPIPALGHTVVVEEGFEAVGCDDGLSDRHYCSVCNEELQPHTVIPAPHNPGEIVREELPEDFEDNEDNLWCCIGKYFCQDCGKLVYEELRKHEPDEPVIEELGDGHWRETIFCKFCNFIISVIEHEGEPG